MHLQLFNWKNNRDLILSLKAIPSYFKLFSDQNNAKEGRKLYSVVQKRGASIPLKSIVST